MDSITILYLLSSACMLQSAHLVTFGNTQHGSNTGKQAECVADDETAGYYGNIGVQCCSSETALGWAEAARPGCNTTSPYLAAKNHCASDSNYPILCSIQQLYYKPIPNGAASGCQMDYASVWSRTSCTTLGLIDPATIIPYYTYSLIWHDPMETNPTNNWSPVGDVELYSSINCPNGEFDDCFRMRSEGSNSYIDRSTNISAYSFIGLQFDLKVHSLEPPNDFCEIWYKYDDIDNIWYKLWNQSTVGKYQDVTVDLPLQKSSMLSIRLEVNADDAQSDRCYWDNIMLFGDLNTFNPTSSPTENPSEYPSYNPTS
eukprot:301230_1